KTLHVVLSAAIYFIHRRDFTNTHNLFKLFAPFFLIGLLCLFWSETLFLSFQKTLSYFVLFITVPQYLIRSYEDRGKMVFKDLIYFAIVLIIGSFLWRFINPDFVFLLGSRFRGVFGNPNSLGVFLV